MTEARPLPTGTVTFLRTDVEGSMRLVRDLGPEWDAVNATHMGLIRRTIDDAGGTVVRTEGDAMFAVFPEARAAITAAVEAQRALATHAWPDGIDLRVRMGLHSGEAYLAGDDYGGFEVNRAARIAAAGHGGQILVSETTRALVVDALPSGAGLRDLGSHTLRDIPRPERLYQLDVPGMRSDFPPLRTAGTSVGDLPARLTSFIGRDADVEAVTGLLREHRVVTITGPGGIGKTSLAVEAARSVARDFPDGTWFVGLADVEDASTVTAVIARTVGLFDGPGRPAAEALLPYLRERGVLLLLDNFEHLLDSAGQVAEIVAASRRSHVLVTSRAPLRIAGEQEYPLDPLGDSCARLFVERARAVRPAWEPGPEASIVDEVCALVDCLPLGVELAAARVAHLPLTAVRDRLAAHLPLPGSGPRNVPDRQRTLAGAIAWSHELLSPSAQRVLHDLSVFEGGFDLEQAEGVVRTPDDGGDVLDHLVALVDQSLVQRDAPDAGGAGVRFRLLETIRGFALDRLREEGAEAAARRRHATAFLALAEAAAPNMPSADQPRWLDRLTADYPNLRAAVRWSIDAGEIELAHRFVAALWRFWQQDGRLADGTELAEEALRMPGADAPTDARMKALAAAGSIAYWHGRQDVAGRYYTEELAIAQQLGDIRSEADANWNLSFATYIGGDPSQARAMSDRALELFEQAGDERGAARVGWSYLTVASADRSNPGTLDDFLGLLARFERLGDLWYAGQTMLSLSWALVAAGDMAEATRWYIRAVTVSHGLRDVSSTTLAMPLAAMMALEAQRPEDAARLLGAFDHFGERYGVRAPMGLSELLGRNDPLGIAQQLLGPEVFQRAFDAGRQMTLADAVGLAARLQDET
ncbi:MAG TPA: NB-ARC domain-containing protein, partial [Solirubrobacterales bacterium]|nr:NB-ARC domain-containing protein [Solirubrobacterales bacterium]